VAHTDAIIRTVRTSISCALLPDPLPPGFAPAVADAELAPLEPEVPVVAVAPPAAPLDVDDASWPLISTCRPTCSRRSGVVPRRTYVLAAVPLFPAAPLPFGAPPLSAGVGDVLPARAAGSLLPDPGGVGDDTALPPPGLAPTRALASTNVSPLADDERLASLDPPDTEPAVPTLPVALPPGCRQPVTVIEPCCSPSLVLFCA
jgi:hypothetical protein